MDNPFLSVKSLIQDRLEMAYESYPMWLGNEDFQDMWRYRINKATSNGTKACEIDVMNLCYLELANRDMPFTRQVDVYKFMLDMVPIKVYDVIQSSKRELN